MSIDVQQGGMNLSDRVAEEIRALLARRRMSGRELARKLEVSPSWVSYRLTGSQPIDLNDLERIAAHLGVDVVDLMPRRRSVGDSGRDVAAGVGAPAAPVTGVYPRGGRPPGRPDGRHPSGSRPRAVLTGR